MLTKCAISMQSYDYTVPHKPGEPNIIPDTLLQISGFERQQDDEVKPLLTPICRVVPEDPTLALHTEQPHQPFQFSADKLDYLDTIESDRGLFTVITVDDSAMKISCL